MKLIMRVTGFDNVEEIDELESIEIAGGTITGLPFLGEHADLNIRAKMAYLIDLKGKSILLAADSNNIEPELYGRLHELFGNIDVLFWEWNVTAHRCPGYMAHSSLSRWQERTTSRDV